MKWGLPRMTAAGGQVDGNASYVGLQAIELSIDAVDLVFGAWVGTAPSLCAPTVQGSPASGIRLLWAFTP